MSPAVQQLLMVLIPALVPVLIAGLKTYIPKIPKQALPILAPILGVGIDYATSYATGTGANPILAAFLGSAGTGLREIVDQVKQTVQTPPPDDSQPITRIGLP